MEGLDSLTRFWVPLKPDPPLGRAKPPNGAEEAGGRQRASPGTLLRAAAGPSWAADVLEDIVVGIVEGVTEDIMVGIAVGFRAGIVVGIVVGTAAGSVSQLCKTGPARAIRLIFRSAELHWLSTEAIFGQGHFFAALQ